MKKKRKRKKLNKARCYRKQLNDLITKDYELTGKIRSSSIEDLHGNSLT